MRKQFCLTPALLSRVLTSGVLMAILLICVPVRAERHALIIGVDTYQQDTRASGGGAGITALSGACADARHVTRALREVGGFKTGNIRLLTSDAKDLKDRPTRNTLLHEVRDVLPRKVKAGDMVFVFFSGHGVEFKSGGSYLLPSDADPRGGEESLRETAIATATFAQRLGRLASADVVAVYDMCRNDPFGQPTGQKAIAIGDKMGIRQAREAVIQAATGPRAAVTLFSCRPEQSSWESKSKRQGFFSYYLCAGLRGAADTSGNRDGIVRVPELVSYVEKAVPPAVKAEKGKSIEQTPYSETRGTGALEIVLSRGFKPGVGNPLETTPVTMPRVPAKTNPKDGAQLVLVPAGEFIMGSSRAEVESNFRMAEEFGEDVMHNWFADQMRRRSVYLDSYWIYKTEVTVAQYKKFCEETKRAMPDTPPWGWKDNHPIVNVSWADADAYCKWAGGQLPTEAQWEKAARGNDARLYVWGNEWPPPTKVGNVADESSGFPRKLEGYDDGFEEVAPVGSFPEGASPYGVLDMAGNVWEWCADWSALYDDNALRNPTGPKEGHNRITRGGGWDTLPYPLRTAYRGSLYPENRSSDQGFRCVIANPTF